MNPCDEWSQAFPGSPPIGRILREVIHDRWVRFHCLPQGQRTPTQPAQFEEVLHRYNVIASVMLGIGAQVTAWLIHYGPISKIHAGSWCEATELLRCTESDTWREEFEGATLLYLRAQWCPGAFDTTFKLMATGDLASLTLFSPATLSVFCPYEGGMDVFTREASLKGAIKTLFSEWLSELPSGL